MIVLFSESAGSMTDHMKCYRGHWIWKNDFRGSENHGVVSLFTAGYIKEVRIRFRVCAQCYQGCCRPGIGPGLLT